MKMLTIWLLMEGKEPECCLFNFEPESVWNAKTGADKAGKKKGFHSTKSIKATFLNYLIVSWKSPHSTCSGSGDLFIPWIHHHKYSC